jgi:hypothetical protein
VVPRGDKGDAGGITGGTLTGDIDADGNDILNSGNLLEQGKHTIWLPAGAWTPHDSGMSSKLETRAGSTFNTTVLDFDYASGESASTSIDMPPSWDRSADIEFRIVFATDQNGETGDVAWKLEIGAGDDGVNPAVAIDNGILVATVLNDGFLQISPIDTIATNGLLGSDTIFMRFRRVPGNANDTLSADARLIGVRLFYTVNAPNDA